MEKPKVTHQQILDAVAHCADGKRFNGECDKCPLKPFNSYSARGASAICCKRFGTC